MTTQAQERQENGAAHAAARMQSWPTRKITAFARELVDVDADIAELLRNSLTRALNTAPPPTDDED